MDLPFKKKGGAPAVEHAKVGKLVLPAVGVDIGSGSVRVVKVSKVDSDGFAIVDRFGIAQLSSDAVDAGHIRKPQMVAAALLKALQAVGSTRNVIVGVNVPEEAIARIALPAAVRPTERVDSIRATNPQLGASLSLADAELDLNFVRQELTADGRTMAAVIAAAVTTDNLEQVLEVCRLAKVTPRAVDLTAAGTLRALIRATPESTDVAAIVDIGATSTTIIIREGLLLRSVRVIPGGGIELTRAIQSVLRDGAESAEHRKLRMALPATDEEVTAAPAQPQAALGFGGELDQSDTYDEQLATRSNAEKAFSQAAELLINQIAQAIETDASQMGVATPHVALCGGTALTRGLRGRLARRLSVEVRIGHPWARLAPHKDHKDYFRSGKEDPRLMLSLASATGLALWRPVR